MKYLKQGLQHTDVWCTWTVEKKDCQTITFSINLSGVLQESAKAALDDPKADFSPQVQSLLESLAYYSELKAYTTYFNPEKASAIELPKEAKNAVPVGDILPAPAGEP